MSTQVLVLDQGCQMLNVVNWQKAMTLVMSGRAEIVEESNHKIHTVKATFTVPSIIMLIGKMVGLKQQAKFNRTNVFKRDEFTCQYCGNIFHKQELTLDHVIPRSQGGETSWTNVVAACKPCNLKKAARTPKQAGLHLLKKPKQPHRLPFTVYESELTVQWTKWVPTANLKIVKKD
jgi:5-methylcytosine-specific restriction endonuclease McrA